MNIALLLLLFRFICCSKRMRTKKSTAKRRKSYDGKVEQGHE